MTDPAGAGRLMLTYKGGILMGSMLPYGCGSKWKT